MKQCPLYEYLDAEVFCQTDTGLVLSFRLGSSCAMNYNPCCLLSGLEWLRSPVSVLPRLAVTLRPSERDPKYC